MTTELTARWTPTQADFDAFARVSGDDNPIHVDPEFSARTAFGRTVSHGMLIYSKLWGLLQQMHPKARQRRQSMMFSHPAYTGEEVLLRVRETAPGQFEMQATRAADGAALLTGEAEIEC
ncbi:MULTISPECIES: MaoC family dehydratase [Sediminimonas]|uniref:MaoC family dehydratase n=1 Tax=Sediminimonas TaxID=659427 RepID=UPI00042337D6|nr:MULTISPECIES: MaoC/PaaZ C-terminal domain-containing protein [Sediminimonas]MDR9484090.1 MaoC/PaaZ C-terminal domain-containing protein [Sediminimonas sp.]